MKKSLKKLHTPEPTGRYFTGKYWKVKAEGHPAVAHLKPKYQYVAAARLAMEEKLGRHLEPNEKVYHINGDRADDRIENLEILLSMSDHNRKYRWKKGGVKNGNANQ